MPGRAGFVDSLVVSRWLIGVLLATCFAVTAGAAEIVLVDGGKPQAAIVLAAAATPKETLAAKELATHIQAISQVELPIVVEGKDPLDPALVVIRIGSAAAAEVRTAIQTPQRDTATFRLRAKERTVDVVGKSDDGTLYAAYALLEQLGVRWFFPGELGMVVPARPRVAIAEQDTTEEPAFQGRVLQAIGDATWAARMKLGGLSAGAHGLGPKFDRTKYAELYYEENGKRTHQLRVSHPEVLRRTIEHWQARLKKDPQLKIINIGPDDGSGFGSDPWDAFDYDPLVGKTATTDRYIKFFNLVLEEIHKTHPDVQVAFYAYTQELRPPVRERPNPKILPVLAPIGVDRLHAINNPRSWERAYIRELIDGWQKTGLPLLYRGYLFNLADQGLPFSMIDLVRNEFPYYHERGVISIRTECMPAWGYHAPSLYLAARMMWNPKLDVDATLNEYFDRLYGPAAKPVQTHFQRLEQAFITTDYCTGNVFDMPRILNDKVLRELETSLSVAEDLSAADPKIAARVRMIRLHFEYGKSNLAMMAAFNRLDLAAAKAIYDQILNEQVPILVAHQPPIIFPRSGVGYLKRFWGRSIDHGVSCVTGENTLVAKLPDEWLSMLDPNGAGEELGLWKPDLPLVQWRPLKTYSTSWSNQGLRYYRGAMWYRTTIEIPAEYQGRNLHLWLGGVDEHARAWINGTPLEVNSTGSAPIGLPWDFAATPSIRFGDKNTIVIKVTNIAMNELGTGGLTGPAMIWASGPAASK